MTSYGNVVLERGLADDYLLRWHQDVIDGKVERRTVTIVVYDETGTRETWRWLVERAYPVKWTGTDLDAASGAVLVESVELTHHGFRRA
jgi:phage tail-like protein